MPEVEDFPHSHREFLFLWLEYCSHFLFIGFSTELKSVVDFDLIDFACVFVESQQTDGTKCCKEVLDAQSLLRHCSLTAGQH